MNFVKKRKLLVSFFIVFALSNSIFLILYQNNEIRLNIFDADRKSNGNTLVVCTSFVEIRNYPNRIEEEDPVEPDRPDHRVIEINNAGKILWEFTGLAYPHEVVELPNGHLLIADTNFDRVIEVNYPDEDIVWSWEPKEINWTEVNGNWDSDHYYNNYKDFDWTHLNDVDFKEYDTWDACLVCLRNFNLIVEINYTAEIEGPANNPQNIVWYFGDYDDPSIMNMQHNPEYTEDGNILVADSSNNRIIEVDKDKKEVIWTYDEGLKFPRDADEVGKYNILITDSGNNRIIEIEKKSKKVVWSYRADVVSPYEADRLENGNTLIGNGIGGFVSEINSYGMVLWTYGFSFFRIFFYMNSSELLLFEILGIFSIRRSPEYKNAMPKERKMKMWTIRFLIIFLGPTILMFFIYNDIVNLIFMNIFRQVQP